MTEIVIVAAVAANGVIGKDGAVPWDLPEDLRRFKETTLGSPVIMGRLTFESIEARLGGPLPGRTNVVLTRGSPDLPDDVVVAGSVAEALDEASERDDIVYVIGGATVYEAFLPRADRLLLTEIDREYRGDTTFPAWDREEWTELERDERDGYAFVEYVRRDAKA